jgi:drug/metabolite transporter (DMT)-like permease
MAWSSGTVYARRKLRGVDPVAASAIETAVAGPLMLGIHLLVERGQPIQWGGQAWLAVGYLAVMGSLVGFTAFAYLAAHMSSSKVGTYAYVNPVVAVLLGWLLAGERLEAVHLAAAAMIVLGVVLITSGTRSGRATGSKDERAERP